ncbi:ribosome-assembly protein 3-domain-containing protein [Lasiosphaeria ovina]|uniref:Ribosome assembly protein 3 n=1 Tax=Lasiosphaeria ovina TaxID=92902 RepID=A0AAE0NAA6_9PEZI|nr:ribosome-assembly protein 3-domain-containing protein [Lasiosphaeria ovina]
MGKSQETQMTEQEVASEFKSYYLQRATKEFAEDLDKVRGADDFRNDALQILVSALQQGTELFSPEDQRRIVMASSSSTSSSAARA